METVSAPDGTVRLAEWGPTRVGFFATPSVLKWPKLVVFKPGYRVLVLTNSYTSPPGKPTSDHNGRRLKLRVFRGDDKQWREELHRLEGFLSFFLLSFKPCMWKHIPQMLGALIEEGERAGVSMGTSLEGVAHPERCGSLLAYVRERLR
jgi:hypothetical protein